MNTNRHRTAGTSSSPHYFRPWFFFCCWSRWLQGQLATLSSGFFEKTNFLYSVFPDFFSFFSFICRASSMCESIGKTALEAGILLSTSTCSMCSDTDSPRHAVLVMPRVGYRTEFYVYHTCAWCESMKSIWVKKANGRMLLAYLVSAFLSASVIY